MKRLYLSQKDKKIAGICGGIGEIYDIDPILIRLVFVFLCLLTGLIPLTVTYLIGWLIIPQKHAEE